MKFKVHSIHEIEDNHHIYVDVMSAAGIDRRDPGLKIEYEWEGMRPEEKPAPIPLDKPLGEHAGNIPLNPGMTVRLRIIPGECEWAEGISFRGLGSWLVIFEEEQP